MSADQQSETPSWSPAATCARPPTGSAGRPRPSWSGTSRRPSRGTASRVRRAHPVDAAARPRLHLQPADGHGRLRGHRPRRAAHRGRGGLAVQPPRAGRPAPAPRPDPDRRQLERRSGRASSGMLNLNASLTKMGVPYSSIWSEDFTDDVRRRAIGDWIADGHDRRTTPPTSATWTPRALPPMRRRLGRRLAGELRRPDGHPGRLRRRLHGHVQRHHRRRVPQPDGHLQGAPQPVRARRRDAPRHRRRGARGLRAG